MKGIFFTELMDMTGAIFSIYMVCKSQCPFVDFAHGLMRVCIDLHKEDIIIEGEDKNSEGLFCRVFTLMKQ